MCRKPGSAAGPPIESGWVTATSFAAMEGQEQPAEVVASTEVIISCTTMLVNGTAKDKLRTYFALYLSEDTSSAALGSARCTDPCLLPRFFDTIAHHYSVPALVLEQLTRDASTVLQGGPDPLAAVDGSIRTVEEAHDRAVSIAASSHSSSSGKLTWDWLWRACKLTKDLNKAVEYPRLSLRSLAYERGSERFDRAQSAAAALQAQHAVCLSPSGIMAAGNISPRSSDSQNQKRNWKERSRRRLERREQLSLQRPSRMSGSTRSLASPNSSYGTMATWELLEQDTDLREERLAQELADASNDSGYIAGLSTADTYIETIGPPIGMDRTGRRSLTSYKEKKMATAPKFVSHEEQAADPRYRPSTEELMQAAVQQWHSMSSIC